MRVRDLVLVALAAMTLTSFAGWHLAPSTADAAPSSPSIVAVADAPPEAELEDHSRFVAGATLLLEGRLGHARLASGREQSTYLYATVDGAQGVAAPASPLDLAIVVDTSGSMRGDRLANAVAAARGMVQRLRDQDRVTVITYSTGADVLVPSTIIDASSRSRVLAAIGGMRALGDTCISCGLELALAQARPQRDRVSRILLLSDGEATTGVRDAMGFQSLARRSRALGTTMSTIGVDVGYNEQIMGVLAQFSNGRHYFVQHPTQLDPVFEQELQSLSQTLANDVEMVVELAPGVVVEQVFDRDVQQLGQRLVVPVGTVAPGQQKTFLVQVRVPAGVDAEQPIGAIHLRYQDLVNQRPGECSGTLAARRTEVASEVSELDPFVAARVSRSVTLSGIREANELSARGEFGEARERLASTSQQVSQLQGAALAASEPDEADALAPDFRLQNRAITEASGSVADPGLAAPARSSAGARARHRVETQRRANEDLVNPFAE